MDQGTRTKLIAGSVLATVFASGTLLGYAARGSDAIAAEAAGCRQRTPVYTLMNPTEEELVLIKGIMHEQTEVANVFMAELMEHQTAHRERMDSLYANTRERIALVFPIEDRAEYQRLLAENDRRKAERDAAAAAAAAACQK